MDLVDWLRVVFALWLRSYPMLSSDSSSCSFSLESPSLFLGIVNTDLWDFVKYQRLHSAACQIRLLEP
jgi:hypothetical protein